MHSDEQIEAELAALRPISYDTVPIEGHWRTPPFEQRAVAGRTVAVLCEEPEISAVVVDRDSGEVLVVDPDGAAVAANHSLAQLVACARAYRHAVREAEPAVDDDTLTAVAERALATFRTIDHSAVRTPDQLWSVAAEELAYGL